MAKDISTRPHYQTCNSRHRYRADQDGLNTLILTGTHILAGKGDCRLIESIHSKVNKSFYICSSGTSCHSYITKSIYCRLDYNIGQGEQHPLKSCR